MQAVNQLGNPLGSCRIKARCRLTVETLKRVGAALFQTLFQALFHTLLHALLKKLLPIPPHIRFTNGRHFRAS